jgi:hypothetical protein
LSFFLRQTLFLETARAKSEEQAGCSISVFDFLARN